MRLNNLKLRLSLSLEAIRRPVHTVYVRLCRVFIVVLVVRTVQEMSADDATHMAAGVAYYALFSMFPLLLGLIALSSMIIGTESLESGLTDFVISFLPGSEEFVSANLRGVPGALGIFAIAGLFWSGSAIFGAVTRAVNRAWDVHKDRPIYSSKLRQLIMALGVGALFFLSIATSTFVRVAGSLVDLDVPGIDSVVHFTNLALIRGSSFLFTMSIFFMIYKYLPNTKTHWKYIWPGALVASTLFEGSKALFLTYLNQFASFDSLYGSLSPVIIFLFWAYVSSLILILGAELSSEYGRLKTGLDRGVNHH